MSKTTFYQIFECISLKVLDTGSLQIFVQIHANLPASCAKKNLRNAFPFFWVKWVYHKLFIFQFQIFDTNWPSLISTPKYLVNERLSKFTTNKHTVVSVMSVLSLTLTQSMTMSTRCPHSQQFSRHEIYFFLSFTTVLNFSKVK